ncbi:hypothetical protein [Streptomyces scopuliridis]|uniref:hypothetical protein n=1 Tax=Streptomyces scopuliridis TaxID=452529 RepID=UPI0036BB5DAE
MNPYQSLPARSFWRPVVAERDRLAIDDLWTPKFAIGQDDPVRTAGSCFAARIGPALLEQGMNWYDAEPAPAAQESARRAVAALDRRSARPYHRRGRLPASRDVRGE